MDSKFQYRGTKAGISGASLPSRAFPRYPVNREKPAGLMQARLNLLAQELH
jgi:hypothetical protein